MPNDSSPEAFFYARSPYAGAFDIEYPQENVQGEMYKYRCRFCRKLTTEINGRLANHAADCEYRLAKETRREPDAGCLPPLTRAG